MEKLIPLLKLLAVQGFVSGQSLGTALSVSRTTISSWVKELENKGVEINTVKGRGYRLVSKVKFLDKTTLLSQFNTKNAARIKLINILSETSSTNAVCLNTNFETNDWKLICSEFQSSGRGRRGRTWASEPFSSLLFSLGCSSNLATDVLYCSSVLAGLSVVQTLNRYLKDDERSSFKIKWPNDIYLNDSKVSGILCELKGSPVDESLLVIGVGMNIFSSPQLADYQTTDLHTAFPNTEIDRSVLLGRIVNDLITTFEEAKLQGLGDLLSCWPTYDYLANRPITVLAGNNTFDGVARGVDNRGQLIVLGDDGSIHNLNGGEVSIRW